MTAYLVGAKTTATPSDRGAMMVYLIEAKTKPDALAAVRKKVPHNWTVEDVLGTADAKLVGLHRPRLHMPEQLLSEGPWRGPATTPSPILQLRTSGVRVRAPG